MQVGQGLPQWVVTDAAAGGQRPLLWADLTPEKLDGLAPPKPPEAWKVSDAGVGLTVNDVEQAILDDPKGGEPAADCAWSYHGWNASPTLASRSISLDEQAAGCP